MARQPDLTKWYRGKVERIEENSAKALEMAAERGEELVKYNIETRGTEASWSGDWGRMPHGTPGRNESSPGRVASGEMRDAVGSWVSRGVDGKTRMGFGWTNPATRRKYFIYQEAGFKHALTRGRVEGMYAIVDAADDVFSQLKRDIRDGLKSA